MDTIKEKIQRTKSFNVLYSKVDLNVLLKHQTEFEHVCRKDLINKGYVIEAVNCTVSFDSFHGEVSLWFTFDVSRQTKLIPFDWAKAKNNAHVIVSFDHVLIKNSPVVSCIHKTGDSEWPLVVVANYKGAATAYLAKFDGTIKNSTQQLKIIE